MKYLGNFAAGATVRGSFNTRTKATGAPITLTGSPALSVYKDSDVTEVTTGVTLTVDFDSIVGSHLFAVVTTDGFYSEGSDFRVVLTAGTVDGESVVGVEVGSFSIANRVATAVLGTNAPTNWINAAAIASNAITSDKVADGALTASKFAAGAFDAVWTVSVRTLSSFGTLVSDIWTAGTRTLTAISDSAGITTLLTRIVGTIASGTHQPQSGDAFARLGAPVEASISADIQTRLPTSGYTTPPTASQNATQVRTELSTELARIDVATSTRLASASYVTPLDAAGIRTAVGLATANLDTQLGDIPTVAEMNARTLLTAEYATSANLTIVAGYLDTEVAAIKAKTDNLPASPAASTDIPTASTVATQVRVELATELARIDVATSTRLASADYTSPLDAVGIRTAIGLAAANLDTQLGDIPTVAEMNARTIVSADYATTTQLTTVEGKIDTVDNFIDTEVAAIKTTTDKLDTAMELDGSLYRFTTNALEQTPSSGGGATDWTSDEKTAIRSILGIPSSGTTPTDPSVGILDTIRDQTGSIPTASTIASQVRTELSTELSRIDVVVSTRLASASYVTPLDAAGVRTAVGLAAANLDTQLGDIPTVAEMNARTILAAEYATSANLTIVAGYLDTEVAAIKAKTDNLPANPAASTDIPSAATIATQVRTELTTELARIDVGIGTRLASTSYVIPLNAAEIREALGLASNNLDTQLADIPTVAEMNARTIVSADYATSTNLSTVAGYIDTEVAAIKAKTDNLPASPASTSDIPSTSAIATQVRVELATELARIDVATSTRLASASYVTPLDAVGIRTAVGLASANLDTQLGDIPTVSEFNARTLTSVSYATATQLTTVEGKIDTVDNFIDTEVAAIKAKTDNLPTSPAASTDIPSATTIASQVRTELTTELNRIDVATSTRLSDSSYTAPLDAPAIRAAVGLASANLDTQLADIPTVAEMNARTIVSADYATASQLATVANYLDTEIQDILTDTGTTLPNQIATLNILSQADVRAAVGLASANLDAQLAALPTTLAKEATSTSIKEDTEDIQQDITAIKAILDETEVPEKVIVDQDFGGTGNLTYELNGEPVADTLIEVFLYSDYVAGNYNSNRIDSTRQRVDGTWAKPFYLDPQEYVIRFYRTNVAGPDAYKVVVSFDEDEIEIIPL